MRGPGGSERQQLILGLKMADGPVSQSLGRSTALMAKPGLGCDFLGGLAGLNGLAILPASSQTSMQLIPVCVS